MKAKPKRSLALHTVYTETGWEEKTHEEYLRYCEHIAKCARLCGVDPKPTYDHIARIRDIKQCPICNRGSK